MLLVSSDNSMGFLRLEKKYKKFITTKFKRLRADGQGTRWYWSAEAKDNVQKRHLGEQAGRVTLSVNIFKKEIA